MRINRLCLVCMVLLQALVPMSFSADNKDASDYIICNTRPDMLDLRLLVDLGQKRVFELKSSDSEKLVAISWTVTNFVKDTSDPNEVLYAIDVASAKGETCLIGVMSGCTVEDPECLWFGALKIESTSKLETDYPLLCESAKRFLPYVEGLD